MLIFMINWTKAAILRKRTVFPHVDDVLLETLSISSCKQRLPSRLQSQTQPLGPPPPQNCNHFHFCLPTDSFFFICLLSFLKQSLERQLYSLIASEFTGVVPLFHVCCELNCRSQHSCHFCYWNFSTLHITALLTVHGVSSPHWGLVRIKQNKWSL